jgi:hypothetical protein
MAQLDHMMILAISETGPTIWTFFVAAVTTGTVAWLCLRGRDDDR